MEIGPRFFIVVYLLLTITIFLYSSIVFAQDELNFGPMPGDVSSLERIERQNNQQIRILEDQLTIYSDYLASRGQSEEIHVDRHLNAMPDSVFVLGVGSGAVSGGIGLVSALSGKFILRRFFWAGAMITVAATITDHYLEKRADSTDGRAGEEMVGELDADPDPHIRGSMEALMVKQLLDLRERNRAIRFAIERRSMSRGRNSPEYVYASGIIPQNDREIRTASTSP